MQPIVLSLEYLDLESTFSLDNSTNQVSESLGPRDCRPAAQVDRSLGRFPQLCVRGEGGPRIDFPDTARQACLRVSTGAFDSRSLATICRHCADNLPIIISLTRLQAVMPQKINIMINQSHHRP